jgi:hypothetical protein
MFYNILEIFNSFFKTFGLLFYMNNLSGILLKKSTQLLLWLKILQGKTELLK